jgi:uncharacterized damage-inducible protein DinB
MFQHVLDTYVSEISKIAAVWRHFSEADMSYRPHPKSSTVAEQLKHQLLSERRFFGEFMGVPELPPAQIMPDVFTPDSYARRLTQLASRRLAFLAGQNEEWWLEPVRFFDVTRERIWIFWRRVLHSAHHRTQLTVYLRMMEKPVPAVYGPSADESWDGADPTNTVEAAGRQ